MKKSRHIFIYPDWFGLLLVILITSTSFTLQAEESSNYSKYEKIFSTVEMESLNHKKFKLSVLSTPIVIVNFWASWCIPCLEEMPSLIKLSEKYKASELSIVAINTDQDGQLKNIAKTQRKLSIPNTFIIVPDQKFMIADAFKFSAIPVTVVFKKGKVVYFSNGPVDFLKIDL
jgi:thiol-disulfide isomerase/thioredoxin